MFDIAELKSEVSVKTLYLVLLSFLTLGIYNIAWLFSTTIVMERITTESIVKRYYLIFMTVLLAWSGVFASVNEPYAQIANLAVSLSLITMYVVWAFKARTALQRYALKSHQFALKMNRFYTFFFTFYYINYCLNDLPNAKVKALLNKSES